MSASTYSAVTSPAPMRLTRRGKVVVWLLALALLVAVSWAGSRAMAEGPHDPLPSYTIAVQAGDTLWSIAAEVTPQGHDVRQTISEIMRASGMSRPDLAVGQQLTIPYSDGR